MNKNFGDYIKRHVPLVIVSCIRCFSAVCYSLRHVAWEIGLKPGSHHASKIEDWRLEFSRSERNE